MRKTDGIFVVLWSFENLSITYQKVGVIKIGKF